MSQKPWVSGPIELLCHGLKHIENGSDFDLRMAMISIDNAVEASIYAFFKYYVKYDELDMNYYKKNIKFFPGKLDLLEKYAKVQLGNIQTSNILFYHHIRNDLYHKGNGITVEKKKVEEYATLSRKLIRCILNVPVGQLIKERNEKEQSEKKSKELKFGSQLEGMVAIEKNIERFIKNNIQGAKKIAEEDIPALAKKFGDFIKSVPNNPNRKRIFIKTSQRK